MIRTIDPSTGETLETFAFGTGERIETTLDGAARAAAAWRIAPTAERASLLTALAARLRANARELAETAVREMGKPIAQARAEVEKCAWCCEYFAQAAEAMLAPQEVASGAGRSYVAFRPLGVVFAIMPWNFPYWQLFRAAVPALVAGNAILLKHAPNTTRCALEIERVFREAGAPEGLFGVLIVADDTADELIADARIAAVTLTGSERAGTAVAAAAGSSLKKCVLELGGSDAFVVLADADLDTTVSAAVAGRFQNNGQSCIAAKRFVVEASLYDAFVQRFGEAAAAQSVGNPMDERHALGPCAREDLRAALHEQVRATVAAGATLVTGGAPVDRPGFFYAPTVVAGVAPGTRMFEEEVFGPAAAVVRARDADDALRLANASGYGLGFSIWTRDIALAERLAARAEAGAAFVNGIVVSDPRLPFGGVKRSGYGRELSAFGVHEFTNIQTVWVR